MVNILECKVFTLSASLLQLILSVSRVVVSVCLVRPKPCAWLSLSYSPDPSHPLSSFPCCCLVPTPFHQLIPLHPFLPSSSSHPGDSHSIALSSSSRPVKYPSIERGKSAWRGEGEFEGDHGEKERDNDGWKKGDGVAVMVEEEGSKRKW